jgi:hypothetical protein
MRFRLLGLPIRRLPYLFAQPYTGAPAADMARPSADATKPPEAVDKNPEPSDSAVPTGRLVDDLAADHRHE